MVALGDTWPLALFKYFTAAPKTLYAQIKAGS